MNNPKGTKLVQKVILSRKELRWSAQRRTTMFTFRLITTKVIWVKFEKSALSLPSLSTDWSYITQIQKSRTNRLTITLSKKKMIKYRRVKRVSF